MAASKSPGAGGCARAFRKSFVGIRNDPEYCNPPETFQRQADLSITPETVAKVGGVVIKKVKFGADLGGYLEFGDDSTQALIIGCFDCDHLVDVVAADIKNPKRFARLERRAWCIGQHFDWWNVGDPLTVWRNPLTWLQNGGDGVVIFDFEEAHWQLPDRTLIPEDDTHGRQIRAALQPKPWSGQIMIRKAAVDLVANPILALHVFILTEDLEDAAVVDGVRSSGKSGVGGRLQ